MTDDPPLTYDLRAVAGALRKGQKQFMGLWELKFGFLVDDDLECPNIVKMITEIARVLITSFKT